MYAYIHAYKHAQAQIHVCIRITCILTILTRPGTTSNCGLGLWHSDARHAHIDIAEAYEFYALHAHTCMLTYAYILHRLLSYQLGTAAFGSLIVALVWFARISFQMAAKVPVSVCLCALYIYCIILYYIYIYIYMIFVCMYISMYT